MNTIRVIDFLLEFLPEPTGDMMLSAQDHLRSLVAQYDALAPTPEMWAQYPWAQWCAIHPTGWQYFYDEQEPFMELGDSMWRTRGKRCDFHNDVDLPIGIDWRLCKWQRPAAAA